MSTPTTNKTHLTQTVRIGPVAAVPELLKEFGVSPDQLLAELGIEPSLFEDHDNLIGFGTRTRLLNLCARRTNCEHFGLLVGSRAGLRCFGLLGYFVLNSQDVGSALRGFCNFFYVHSGGVRYHPE